MPNVNRTQVLEPAPQEVLSQPPAASAGDQTFRQIFTIPAGTARSVVQLMEHEIEVEGDHRLRLVIRDAASRVMWLNAFPVPRNRPIDIEPNDLVLRPTPRQLELRDQAWLMPPSLTIGVQGDGDRFPAEHLAEMLTKRYGVEVRILRDRSGTITLSYGQTVADHAEGYQLDITASGIQMQASTGRGMYYAVRTLLDAISQSSRGGRAAQAQALHCVDWPTRKRRVLFMRIDNYYPVSPGTAAYEDFIYNQVAGGKFNTLIITVRGAMQYNSHPEVTIDRSALTQSQMRQIVQFAKQHYLDVIPGGNSPGHGGWLIRGKPELAYQGDTQMLNIRDPQVAQQVLKTVTDIYDELIDVFDGPEFFHIGGDEVRFPPTDDPAEIEARHLYVRDHWLALFDYFREKGIRPLMWSDMFPPTWNGGAPHHFSRILPQLPREVIIVQWTAGPGRRYPASKYHELGFETWRITTSFSPTAADQSRFWDKQIKGTGIALFTPWPWLTFTHTPNYRAQNAYSVGLYLAAETAWNMQSIERLGAARLLQMFGPHWIASMQVPHWGARQLAYEPLALGGARNHRMGHTGFISQAHQAATLTLPNQTVYVSGVPFERAAIAANDSDVVYVASEQSSAPIVVGKRVDGLVFKHTIGVQTTDGISQLANYVFRRNRSAYAMNLAHYMVHYEDGQVEQVPVKMGWNVHFWDCYLTARIMAGASGYWTTFTDGQRQRDPHRPDVTFWTLSWPNPRPQVPIQHITIQTTDTGADLYLVGLTAVHRP